MKLGRAVLPTGEIRLVRIDEDKVTELTGVTEADLIKVAMARGKGAWQDGRSFAQSEVRFLPPVARPTSLRDFSAFEAHTKNCTEGIGGKMNPLWYEIPVFYFSNPNCIIGDGDTVLPPKKAKSIDYELEVAALIGAEVRDYPADGSDWLAPIAGFFLMNDWSARDLGSKEMQLYMGPVKAKDFATSFGPWLVTPDEFEEEGGRLKLPLTARVNGETWSNGQLSEMYFNWPRVLSHASADVSLVPGDVIGSGTCGSGCIIELRITSGKEKHHWLVAGDVVELEAPKLGTLRNTIGKAA
ncbi:MAG: 2-keto-4-pentenoate hydratase/2-oxohepta-3-ene,7-dioic acid hydratase [Hydrocarboniphaga sp.]|uniref:fumarylacetoacetate hydrolase family protein n=1 Tax=Hydrocarboniphaga sp. TaxID=2033016 RepID=UPI00262893C9|nr:fumarylacetoacetate hydrolase family protein [Hydrocarboniphaga sp.]MDB5970014.1 2-keto-4-pentenoate hydratase/2-oxohepta-3-ene,7-dioic acid hydratase [Hydrocarboniphaga sp.]